MFELLHREGGTVAVVVVVLAAVISAVALARASLRRTESDSVNGASSALFPTVFWGYFWGFGVLIVPFALVFSVGGLLRGAPTQQVLAPLLFPLILALQGAILGLVITIGDAIRRNLAARVGRGRR